MHSPLEPRVGRGGGGEALGFGEHRPVVLVVRRCIAGTPASSPVNVDLGGIQVTGGGDFLSLPQEKQEAIIMSHFEVGLRGALAQSTAARVRGALI